MGKIGPTFSHLLTVRAEGAEGKNVRFSVPTLRIGSVVSHGQLLVDASTRAHKVAIFLWCTVSSVRCIFGVMYMHFWYAMHRHLWWCLVSAITIVQCIFGAVFLGLGCNIFFGVASLVLCIVSFIAQACYRSGAYIYHHCHHCHNSLS